MSTLGSRVRFALEAVVVTAALQLPETAQRALLRRPVVRDGHRMSTEMQMVLALQRLGRQPHLGEWPLERARQLARAQGMTVAGRQPIGALRSLTVDGADGPLDARFYIPSSRVGADPVPTLMFLHGGGMALGDLDSHDAACRHLAERSGVQVLAVDYRQPPEHRFPAAVNDSVAAYQWMVKNADALNADPVRLAVGGDSAGGNLAATTAILAAEAGLPMALQLLIYPITDFVTRSRSRELFGGGGFYLSGVGLERLAAWYFEDATERRDALASVLLRTDFPPGLAPAHVITAGFDPLRDEGEAYADLLARHGVQATRMRYSSMAHAFTNIVGVGREIRQINVEIAETLGQLLA
jgi:acetyl esterase